MRGQIRAARRGHLHAQRGKVTYLQVYHAVTFHTEQYPVPLDPAYRNETPTIELFSGGRQSNMDGANVLLI